MKEEIAENKLLRLLKESKIDKGKDLSLSPSSSNGSNKLLSILRSKGQPQKLEPDVATTMMPRKETQEQATAQTTGYKLIDATTALQDNAGIKKTFEPLNDIIANNKSKITNGTHGTQCKKTDMFRKDSLSVVQLYVFVTKEELDLLEKLTQEASSFATLLFLIFGHNLMAREFPSVGGQDLSTQLGNYMCQQSSYLHRLLVKARLGQEVVLGQLSFPEHDELQKQLLDWLVKSMQVGKEARVPALSVETGRLILVSSLTPERLRFFQKLSQERHRLGMVLHLFFSHLLMAQEVVVQSAGQLAQAFALNELLGKYRTGQDAFLNKLLLATRMQRSINLKEDVSEQQIILKKLLEGFKQLVKAL